MNMIFTCQYLSGNATVVLVLVFLLFVLGVQLIRHQTFGVSKY